MNHLRRAAVVAALVWGVAAWAQGPPPKDGGGPGLMGSGPPPGPPAFVGQMFPPAMVMQHQQEIGLRPAQIDAIKHAMAETQQRLVDLQWELESESEALGKLLAADRVDEATVLVKLAKVTSIEQQVKQVNFTLLVRIKNTLDPEQQATLRALRRPPSGPPGGPPPA
ncbi:MAG TPA: periplasmic heavy metal sensor [Candidatus Eisenbacteria bacterium]|nr:periplasmic heavy metal sensor [Candidatus Eisenbacteria bacterium]